MEKEPDIRKDRTFILKLSDEDAELFFIKARTSGINMTEVLEEFIQDLICSCRSRGPVGRDLISRWFDKRVTEIGMRSDGAFLQFALERGNDEWALRTWRDLQEVRKRLDIGINDFCDQEEMDSARKDAEYWQKSLEEFYQEYEENRYSPGKGMEKDLEELEQWQQKLDRFMKGANG